MDLQLYLNQADSRFATVAMSDTNGLLRGQMVSVQGLAGMLKDGMGMAPAQLALDPTDEILAIPGVTDDSGDFHDGRLAIDPDTARRLPWAKPGHDLLLLSHFADDSAAICPRATLARVVEQAATAGFTAHYGLELEYTLFDESAESARDKGYRNLRTATPEKSHDLLAYQVLQSDWYEAVADMCESMDINLAKMHEEIGGGFMEACIAAGDGMVPADQAVLLKNFLRILAMRGGQSVTFMPRWSESADSQSMHVHMSLLNADAEPLFHQSSAEHGMSETFRFFIGGLQRHLGDLSLLFLPTVNSYRRFAPGTFAPPGLSWGIENRTTCFRIVGNSPASMRVENRLAGADANPYLIVAAMLAAGVEGIKQQIEPEAAISGSGYEQPGGPDFARSMPEAIERLQQSTFAKQVLGERFVDAFSSSRQSQYEAFCFKVPDVELERYFSLG